MFKEINECIYQSYITEKNSKTPREDNTFWPSQASIKDINGKVHGCCMRQLYYNMKAVPITNPPTTTTIRKMEFGKKIEDYEIEMAKKANILIDTQVPFEIANNNIKIRGKMDGIGVENLITKGMEYKSSGGYMFKTRCFGTAYTPPMPKIPNLLQVMLYLDGFKNHEKYAFDICQLLYVDRGDCVTTEFEIRLHNGKAVVNDSIIQDISLSQIYTRFHELHRFLTTNILPSCEFRPYYDKETIIDLFSRKEITKTAYKNQLEAGYGCDIECSYCEWHDKCVSDINQGV